MRKKVDTKLFLMDDQYLDLLKKLRKDLDSIRKIEADDCDDTGYKDMVCNVGTCAGELSKSRSWYKDKHVTRETSLWPKEFDTIGKEPERPQQYTRKYEQDHHHCPLEFKPTNFTEQHSGCFYRCSIFQRKKKDWPTIEEIKKKYDQMINDMSKKLYE